MIVKVNTEKMREEYGGPFLFMGSVVLFVVVICMVIPVALYLYSQWIGYWLGG